MVSLRLSIPTSVSGQRLAEHELKLVVCAHTWCHAAGIAFLWFIGVIRDRLGGLEDRFFATIFLGSGLLFVGLTFVGAALAAGLLTSYETDQSEAITSGAYSYGRAVMYNVVNVYGIRMAGVFMMSLSSIWPPHLDHASRLAPPDHRAGAGATRE
jgi:hypothetical protein